METACNGELFSPAGRVRWEVSCVGRDALHCQTTHPSGEHEKVWDEKLDQLPDRAGAGQCQPADVLQESRSALEGPAGGTVAKVCIDAAVPDAVTVLRSLHARQDRVPAERHREQRATDGQHCAAHTFLHSALAGDVLLYVVDVTGVGRFARLVGPTKPQALGLRVDAVKGGIGACMVG